MSWVIWITGPPDPRSRGLGHAVAAALEGAGMPVRVLEIEELRRVLVPFARDTEGERDVVHRALGLIAALLAESGVPVIVDAPGPRRAWRDLARAAIPRFAEAHLAGPDPDGSYEAPLAPEVVIDDALPAQEAVARLVALAERLGSSGAAPAARGRSGWAIWITGRPGSGKTSLAARVAQTLAAEGVPVRVLDLDSVRHFLLREPQASETEREVAHRALACAAKYLADAGAAVIVDATAPRRAWRETARALIPRFAEVQLICAEEMCVERERAARWGLGRCQALPGALRAPNVALDYEESVRAELTLRTDTHDLWTTAEQVLFLVRRLERTAAPPVEEPEGRSSR
jgi:adenylylsulfate kinase